MDRIAVVPALALLVLMLAAIANPIQPPEAERVSGLNPLVSVKLLIAGMACAIGAWGLLNSARARRSLQSVNSLMLVGLGVVLVATSAFAYPESATIARAASLIFCCYIAFVLTALVGAGYRATTRAILCGSAIFLATTWLLFLFVPSVGVFHEYTSVGDTVPRMGGTNHPNSIAREAMVAIMLCVAMLRSGNLREERPLVRSMIYGVLIVGFATMVATYSRTSILAGGLALGVMLFDKLWSRFGAMLVGLGMTLALAGILALGVFSSSNASDSAVSAVTKSGDVEELTSFTGRTVIWAEAIELIGERPLTGWGLDSAASVMSEEAVGTHSLLLHVTFSGGVIAGLLLVGLLIVTAYLTAASKEPLVRGVGAYTLLSGLVEDTLIESFPTMLTVLWIMVLLWPAVRGDIQHNEPRPA